MIEGAFDSARLVLAARVVAVVVVRGVDETLLGFHLLGHKIEYFFLRNTFMAFVTSTYNDSKCKRYKMDYLNALQGVTGRSIPLCTGM